MMLGRVEAAPAAALRLALLHSGAACAAQRQHHDLTEALGAAPKGSVPPESPELEPEPEPEREK